ncbi:MAG TPA: restriction endonuclease subunit S [Candidatus Atribacteria bacterium]|jgi:type I restriction enzyme S subunit|uniref:restriction endonuclease subunit S n=1 Tax=Atribacter sp. TaxID=2847780 RepID=UPI00176E1E30|nr:restriction endonuclease subunit S [Candidatus Atribacteria bacterium]
MEVKKGYKQTEIGIIPEDWEVYKIYDICSLSKKRYNPKLSKEVYKCIELEHLSQETGRLLDYCFSDQQFSIKSFFEKEDVLFGKLRPYLKKFYYAEINGVCSTEIWVLKSKTHILSKYLYYLIQTKIILDAANQSTGTKMPRADWNFISNILVFLPPLTEQTAIANALSDIDALIESLEKLITKKCNIKQGAMQQLLTGKKRLPGFKSEWKTTKLSDLGFFRSGNGFPLKFQGFFDGKYPFFKVSDMNIKENKIYLVKANNLIDEDIKNTIYAYVFPRNTIVFAKIGAAIFLERKKMLFKNSCIDNNMMGFVYNENIVNSYYIYLVFHSIKLSKLISVTALPSLNAKDIGKIEFYIPPLPEQTAIAEVLSDMDSEIEALEKKLDKYKKVKQGMMQELLTGKKRLI